MLIEQVIGRLGKVDRCSCPQNPTGGGGVDWVDLTWAQCARRALRINSRRGRELKILLQPGQMLRHGDIVWQSPSLDELVAVNVLPAEVIAGRTRSATQLAMVAFELGNLHLPIELDGDQIISICDGPVIEAFEKHGVEFEKCSRRFMPSAIGTPGVSLSKDFRIERR